MRSQHSGTFWSVSSEILGVRLGVSLITEKLTSMNCKTRSRERLTRKENDTLSSKNVLQHTCNRKIMGIFGVQLPHVNCEYVGVCMCVRGCLCAPSAV